MKIENWSMDIQDNKENTVKLEGNGGEVTPRNNVTGPKLPIITGHTISKVTFLVHCFRGMAGEEVIELGEMEYLDTR